MARVDRLVTWAEIRGGEQVEQLVGARAADDARRVEPVELGDCLAQRPGRAVRVARQGLGARKVGLDGGARPASPSFRSPGVDRPPCFCTGSGASHRTFPLPKAKKRLTFGLKLLANAELSNSQA